MSLWLALTLAAASPQGTALERLARDVVKPLETAGFEGPVGVYVEGSPAPASRAVASLVMAELAARKLGPAPIDAKDATDAERLAREKGLRALLRLTLAWEAPRVVVRGDAVATWVNFWSGETPTRTGPAAVVAASVDADLEALTLVGSSAPSNTPSRPLELNLGVLARSAGWPAAMAVADIDGDKRAEVLALVDDVLVTWSSDGKVRQRVELQAPLSTRPTREPFGLLSVSAGRVLAWSSTRERPESFVWQRDALRSQGVAETLQHGPVTLAARPGYVTFGKELSWAGKTITWPEPVQSLALFNTLALGVGPGGNAGIARGNAPSSLASGVGAGSTLADLDADGAPEVVVTNARALGDGDEVRVLSLGAFESVQSRSASVAEASAAWSRKLEGRVVLAAAGDLDGDGVDEVVLGSWLNDGTAEFFVLRRAP